MRRCGRETHRFAKTSEVCQTSEVSRSETRPAISHGARPGSRLPRRLKRLVFALAALAVLAAGTFLILWHAFPFPVERFDRWPASTMVLDREGRIVRGYVAPDDSWCFPVARRDLSPWLIAATVAVEDGRFRRHRGVDGRAALRALWQMVARRRVVSGASTITMQTVRMMDNRPRTLWAKAVESFRALQLERLRTKDEILTAYLNRAPYGSNLQGAEAAALKYFGKHAADLTLAESALLAGLPQAPSRYRPDRHPDRAGRRQRFVLGEMLRRGAITRAQFDRAVAQPLAVRFRPLPLRAPHACDLAVRRSAGQRRVRTTIDLDIQTIAERALRRQVSRLASQDVSNGAVVVIETRTGAVRALVGSVDYRRPGCGQVNAALSRRSPGSALKPFTYAAAFEAGLCAPSTVLADTPVQFAGYRPENYDRSFRGPVPARTALAASLNIPALRLANDLGPDRLKQLLTDCGIHTLARPASHYGLALTLGSADVRLIELANAYACLARLGGYRPYRVVEEERAQGKGVRTPTGVQTPSGKKAQDEGVRNPVGFLTPSGRTSSAHRPLSRGAAFLVADCLADRARLEAAAGTGRTDDLPTIAWKTGTSTGRRDAWTVAYNPDYTVGVWLGNFDGRGAPALVGVQAAAPVAFEVFRELYRDRPWTWYEPPGDVERRRVCTVSGEPAGPDCPATRLAWRLRGRSRPPCRVHRRVLVDADTGHLLCPVCARAHRARWQPVTVHPPPLARWMAAHGQAPDPLPPHRPDCPAVRHGEGLAILSPADGHRFVLAPDRPADDQQVALRAAAPADARRLFWFADGRLIARREPSRPAHWPLASGRHALRCVDDRGRSATIHVVVE